MTFVSPFVKKSVTPFRTANRQEEEARELARVKAIEAREAAKAAQAFSSAQEVQSDGVNEVAVVAAEYKRKVRGRSKPQPKGKPL